MKAIPLAAAAAQHAMAASRAQLRGGSMLAWCHFEATATRSRTQRAPEGESRPTRAINQANQPADQQDQQHLMHSPEKATQHGVVVIGRDRAASNTEMNQSKDQSSFDCVAIIEQQARRSEHA